MKRIASIISLFLLCLTSYAQDNEFKVYSNGLIYSEHTMKKLHYIVDSLNVKYKSCDLNKTFYSINQTTGYILELKDGNIKDAEKDIKNKMPYEEFIAKYPKAIIQKDVLILKYHSTDYEDKETVVIKHFNVNSGGGFSISSHNLSLYTEDQKNTWLYTYHEKTKYSEESLTAFYFPGSFNAIALPEKYTRMIGYSDCLIDTNSTIYLEGAQRGYRLDMPKNWASLSYKKQEELLTEMRSTIVVGGCSMDSSPREHAMYIALLSAETTHWEVFLRAHLNIMNDRFARMSDGSYAWGERKTYIKELEELNINVSDLLFGTCFRVENPAGNHYYANIGRTGRAFSETKDKDKIVQEMLSIIADPQLDDYNRILFYFLYENYLYYESNEKMDDAAKEKLIKAQSLLPAYYKSQFKEQK